jgi:antitoxin (DNA-binding transcriptional repressor) of toxin-antitoxin stability system
LEEIIANLSPGEEVAIIRDDKPVATLRVPGMPSVMQQLGTPKATTVRVRSDLFAIPDELGGEA